MVSEMRVVCYARISDRDRQGENFSIGTQLQKMREYAQSQNWTVTHELTDTDMHSLTHHQNCSMSASTGRLSVHLKTQTSKGVRRAPRTL